MYDPQDEMIRRKMEQQRQMLQQATSMDDSAALTPGAEYSTTQGLAKVLAGLGARHKDMEIVKQLGGQAGYDPLGSVGAKLKGLFGF